MSGQHKLHWISWHKIWHPSEEGSLGLRNINDVAKTFAMKLWWRFRPKNPFEHISSLLSTVVQVIPMMTNSIAMLQNSENACLR